MMCCDKRKGIEDEVTLVVRRCGDAIL
jgi:hypothetical protein